MHILLILAVFGFLVPNGAFIYYSITQPKLITDALANPIAAVFIGEAMILMFLIAGLLKYKRIKKPSVWQFVLLSLIGSLAFSVPLTLYWVLKQHNQNNRTAGGER